MYDEHAQSEFSYSDGQHDGKHSNSQEIYKVTEKLYC